MSARKPSSRTLSGIARFGILLAVELLLAACGGDGSSAPQEHRLSAAVSGLTTSGLVLSINGANVSVAANTTTMQLSGSIAAGTVYQITVQTQPTGLVCTVSNGAGTMPAADVTVAVSCKPLMTYTIGGFISGLSASGLVLANGADTLSVPSGATGFTMPTALTSGSTYNITVQAQPTGLQCTVGAGSGTVGASAVSSVTVACAPQGTGWIWMGGSTTNLASGVYGTQGVAAVSNVPGARQMPASWTDSAGNLWLFGGLGPDNGGEFNDLWSYSTTTNEWTWVSGSNAVNSSGVYGTQGTPSSNNVAGARDEAASWIDSSGNLWLFGGERYDANNVNPCVPGGDECLNDLWKYDRTSGQWTWESGADTLNATGAYGVKGTPSAGNVPGARGRGLLDRRRG